jgi:hypothetical protein
MDGGTGSTATTTTKQEFNKIFAFGMKAARSHAVLRVYPKKIFV